jgi:hypothetical protein
MPFVGLLALALLVITYVPSISNALVLGDIAKWRAQAEKENRVPSEAWFLECVQLDRNNPQPCTEEDKKKYPKGQMPQPAATVEEPKDAGPQADDDDDLSAIIKGKEAGAAKKGGDDDDDLVDLIKSGDAGAKKEEAPKKKGGDDDDDLVDMIKGGGKK